MPKSHRWQQQDCRAPSSGPGSRDLSPPRASTMRGPRLLLLLLLLLLPCGVVLLKAGEWSHVRGECQPCRCRHMVQAPEPCHCAWEDGAGVGTGPWEQLPHRAGQALFCSSKPGLQRSWGTGGPFGPISPSIQCTTYTDSALQKPPGVTTASTTCGLSSGSPDPRTTDRAPSAPLPHHAAACAHPCAVSEVGWGEALQKLRDWSPFISANVL